MNNGDLISRNAMINMCKGIIAQEWNHKAAPVSWAQAFATFLDLLETAPALTADDYFDAVDRIKPCPNCRYTLLGALTKDKLRWIPVTERLPEDVYGKEREQIVVLVCTKSGKVSQCARMADYECIADETLTKVEWIKNGKFYWSKNKAVTHWMPLPEPPKEDEGESNGKV